MMRLASALACLTVAMLLLAGSCQASFGLQEFDVTYSDPPPAGAEPGTPGPPATQAGSHPYAMTTYFSVNTREQGGKVLPDEPLKDVLISQIPGFIGNQTAVSPCSTVDFLTRDTKEGADLAVPFCPDSSAVGKILVNLSPLPEHVLLGDSPVYLLENAPGEVARIGFWVEGTPVTADVEVSPEPPYEIVGISSDISQILDLYAAKLTLWGVPASPSHDEERGACHRGASSCPADASEVPFLTLPRSCRGPLASSYAVDSWLHPGVDLLDGRPNLSDPSWITGEALSHDRSDNPQGFIGCGKLGFNPSITAKPTTKAAASPTGLDFSLDVDDEGLTNPNGIADADIEKAVVTLPEGFSTNPSLAEGLNVCTEAQLERETGKSVPGEGCPQASKVGTVEVETPLIGESVSGALYIAKPYENPFGSLLALYIVIRNPTLGIIVKQPLEVESDPNTGQITTVAEDLPQLPFSHFRLHFREGARSPLASPPVCGSYEAKATLYPSSGAAPITTGSGFKIISGPDNTPCPSGGVPPFHPNLEAGTVSNTAGRFSPFNVKITRSDSEQEITHFSIKLPPGVAGKLAGIPLCSDAAIAAASARTGPHGGQEELESPSCPAASQVGRTLAGSGVGPSLAYAPGKIYLAGPYHGSPISFVSITSGVVGPFDIGTVVVRLAVKVNPETGEVFLDSTGSDPIPHIIKGIPVHLRDIRAYTDRPEFTFNPTSCARKSTAVTVLGSGLDFASTADDNPFVSTSPFQAADCAALPFEPKLSLSLHGGTKRGDFPKLKAFLRMRGFGEAGVARAQVTLPRSEFIANAHFNTICTRVQFKEAGGNGESCPPGSIYGWARAKTPILSDPLEGPVFLRSSEHQLPDVVASLHGQEIDVHLVGHVDSVKGQLRNTFEAVPDAPVEWASFSFKGASKGLFENSTNLCAQKNRATVKFTGQNGKQDDYSPAVKVKCKGKARHHTHKRAARTKRAAR